MTDTAYDFSQITQNVDRYLVSHWGASIAATLEMILVGILYLLIYALVGLMLVYAERRICAFIQCRLGPNRVGPQGIFQTIADFIKLLLKENIRIERADKLLFFIAPFIIIVGSFLAFGTIPFAKGLHALDPDIGLFFIMAATSIGVIGILLAGWSSNSKYSLIGAMRSGAQIVSYELSVGLAMITMVILTGTLQLSEIIEMQRDGWFIFKGHIPAIISFAILLIAGTAETNRGPFDLAEAESELTAGFHTEYSGIKFAFFFLAEYMNMFVLASVATTLFLGGWMPLHLGNFEAFNRIMDFVPPLVWFLVKVSAVIYVIMLFKWTYPRLRIDQLLSLEWKYLLPINLFNLIFMSVVVLLGLHF